MGAAIFGPTPQHGPLDQNGRALIKLVLPRPYYGAIAAAMGFLRQIESSCAGNALQELRHTF